MPRRARREGGLLEGRRWDRAHILSADGDVLALAGPSLCLPAANATLLLEAASVSPIVCVARARARRVRGQGAFRCSNASTRHARRTGRWRALSQLGSRAHGCTTEPERHQQGNPRKSRRHPDVLPTCAPRRPQTHPRKDYGESRDPGAVAKYVRSQVPNVKACYESALKIDPMLVGRIDTRWTIDADGVPRDVAVASGSMQGSGVADCGRALIEGWRFPKPASGRVEVSFPFVFQSHD